MDTDEAIRTRRSVRVYRQDPLSRETVQELLELAGMAPSSFNSQPWHFHVAEGEARERAKAVLAQTTRYVREYLDSLEPHQAEMAEHFFAELGYAPVLVAISVPETENEADQTNTLIGVGGAIQNLQLAARARELGSCCVTFSYLVRDELAEVFEVAEGHRIVSLVLLGTPAEVPSAPPRVADIATYSE